MRKVLVVVGVLMSVAPAGAASAQINGIRITASVAPAPMAKAKPPGVAGRLASAILGGPAQAQPRPAGVAVIHAEVDVGAAEADVDLKGHKVKMHDTAGHAADCDATPKACKHFVQGTTTMEAVGDLAITPKRRK